MINKNIDSTTKKKKRGLSPQLKNSTSNGQNNVNGKKNTQSWHLESISKLNDVSFNQFKLLEFNTLCYENHCLRKNSSFLNEHNQFIAGVLQIDKISLYSLMAPIILNSDASDALLHLDNYTFKHLKKKALMFQLRSGLFFATHMSFPLTITTPAYVNKTFSVLNVADIPIKDVYRISSLQGTPLPEDILDKETNQKVLSDFGKLVSNKLINAGIVLKDNTRSILPVLPGSLYLTFRHTRFPTEDSDISKFILNDHNVVEFLFRKFQLKDKLLPDIHLNDAQLKQILGYVSELHLLYDFMFSQKYFSSYSDLLDKIRPTNFVSFSYSKFISAPLSKTNYSSLILNLELFVKTLYATALSKFIKDRYNNMLKVAPDLSTLPNVETNSEKTE